VHGGRDDIRKYCAIQKHLNATSAANFQPSVSSFDIFSQYGSPQWPRCHVDKAMKQHQDTNSLVDRLLGSSGKTVIDEELMQQSAKSKGSSHNMIAIIRS